MGLLLAVLLATSFTVDLTAEHRHKRHHNHRGESYQHSPKPHKHFHKGLRKKKLKNKRFYAAQKGVQIPQSLDLRPSLTPIQDQGLCGSCWAFSLTATLTDAILLKYKVNDPLSQQYLVDCSTLADGCNGGYFDSSEFLIAPKGSPAQKNYPYIAQQGTCRQLPILGNASSYTLIGTNAGGPSPADIASVIVQTGAPVSVTIAAAAGNFEEYDGGIYNGCVLQTSDHMLNIVGWNLEGEEFDDKGYLPPGSGYWIARNSWGISWGEKGYFRIQMTDHQGQKCNNIGDEAATLAPLHPVEPPPNPPEPSNNWWQLILDWLQQLIANEKKHR